MSTQCVSDLLKVACKCPAPMRFEPQPQSCESTIPSTNALTHYYQVPTISSSIILQCKCFTQLISVYVLCIYLLKCTLRSPVFHFAFALQQNAIYAVAIDAGSAGKRVLRVKQ